MEERYAKFIDMIKEVRINVPIIDVLPDMPYYEKFLKDLVSNKSKMEQISAAFLNEECSAIVQNKLPPKLDFIILEMEEDNKVPIILGRPFLHTADVIIKVKSKELNLGVGDDRITFIIDKAMQHSHSNDDTCFHMDVINEVTEEELDALLNDSEPFLSTSGKTNETSLDKKFDEFMAIDVEEIPEQ
ncbi:reverse transcriptase domain-containing protein [Tanacetum coccineum]